ncbi:MAG: chorismate-binding protein, partial [Planctomycetota bacterium]
IAFDNVDKTAKIIAHSTITNDVNAAYDEACRAVDDLFDEVDRFAVGRASEEIDLRDLPTLAMEENRTRDDYEQAVARGVEYIHAGDIFQFVPSLRLRARSNARPFDVYRALRVVNPSPYMFYLKTPACTLIGNSPEILCSVQGGKVTSRPLAGTRPRGKTPVEDEQLASELLGDAKEMSEHAMLVDLHRNDVGRVSRADTVRVTEQAVVERYSHVMHISSNVEGELREGLDAFDALRASLPVGTVSGAPKIRAMQIIDELEPTRRGPYGGAVGHADFGGDLDTCIALRTIVHHSGDCFDVQAGAGVVADSVPAKEFEECRNKAEAMLRAVAAADRGFASTLQDGA